MPKSESFCGYRTGHDVMLSKAAPISCFASIHARTHCLCNLEHGKLLTKDFAYDLRSIQDRNAPIPAEHSSFRFLKTSTVATIKTCIE
jgi:hypothetical protein